MPEIISLVAEPVVLAVFVVTLILAYALGSWAASRGPKARFHEAEALFHARRQVSDVIWRDVDAALAEDRRLEAIKLIRERTGFGLSVSRKLVLARRAERMASDEGVAV